MTDGGRRGSTSLIFLCIIMTMIAMSIGGLAIGTLYRTAIGEQRELLAEMVVTEARMIQTLLGGEGLQVDAPLDVIEGAMTLIRESRFAFPYPWLRNTGELLIGDPAGHTLVLLVGTRRVWEQGAAQIVEREERPGSVSRDAGPSEPMLRALAGETGTLVGIDRAGERVLAAYAPVLGASAPPLGLVAKIDLSEIRAPFIEAGSVVTGIAIVMIAFGVYLFFAISDPIISRIREGEARYRELFDSMRSGAAVLEAADRGVRFTLKDLNRAGEQIDSVRRRDVLARPIIEVLPKLTEQDVLAVIRRVWRSGQPESLSTRLGPPGRSATWREQYVYKLPSGEVVVLYDDVTDQKRAEQVLRDSEARWRSIIEMQSIATMIVDEDNHIRFVNHAAETLFGYDADKLVGAPFGFPVVESDVAEIEIIRPKGGVVYAEMQSIPMRWQGEQQFLLFIRDISAHRRAEGDLRKLFQAIEQSPVSVVITDVQGRIEYVNPKFTEATGYTYPEVVGKNPRILKSGYTPSEDYTDLWQTIGSGHVWRGEFYNKKKTGELFWELASIAPVRDVHGKVTHYVAVKEDITDRKSTEDRLRQAHKMQAIGELTGGIAHDFNNLLAIILGNLQLLEEEIAADEGKRELISDAIWSAERGAELTSRLLAFARRQRLNPKITDLNHVVREMTDLLRRTLGERIEIREVLAPGVWKTMIDRGQLESALLNLTVNARDAMPKGGVLTIATANVVLNADEIEDRDGVRPGEYAELSVADTGMGMAAEVAERIFEPFFTTKKFGKGSGLGLSMVYGFVNQSGGHIVVDSEVGRGTTMKVYLPKAASDPEGLPTEDRADLVRRRGGGEIVMVVEDDDRVRKTATKVLRKQGYQVIEAAGAAEALSKLEQSPQLDLLFTDVVLPEGLNGFELAQEVRRRRNDTRLLFTSGYSDEAFVRKGLAETNMELLLKPYRQETLARKVRDVLDRAPDRAPD